MKIWFQKKSSNRFQGCLLGLAVGDAVGTTLEFKPRGSFPPLTDMVGGGPFHLQAGQWTDDTSMALCLATSLVECGGFDPKDQMERYCRWYETGYLSSTGRCFDIGNTTVFALKRFQREGTPYAGTEHPYSAGNGCLMRLAPIPLYFYPDLAAITQRAADSARTTHGALECLEAAQLFGRVLYRALAGQSKSAILQGDAQFPLQSPKLVAIAQGSYQHKPETEIYGTGYVAQSLEAAIWAFARSHSFAEAILMAANLGNDADTTAAICGQVAGAYYGVSGIPPTWLARLSMRQEITALADRLRA